MARKNRNTRTATTTDDAADGDRHLHTVADALDQQNAPTTEDKVREALTDNPGATTAKLAMAAGVGRSTAAKILARRGHEAIAIRTAGDGPRNPDTWTLARSDRDAAAPDIEDAQPHTTVASSADGQTERASDTAEDTGATEEEVTDVDRTTEDPTTSRVADTEADDDDATVTAVNEHVPSSNADAENRGIVPLPDAAPVDPVDGITETEPSPAEPPAVPDATDTARADKDRLPKGGLRALVEEYLAEHPGESFGPAKIGKDLGRSGGAVNNALEKLVTDRYAIKTCEAPKRFAINPDKTDVADTADEAALEA